jgi:hypothetical protein
MYSSILYCNKAKTRNYETVGLIEIFTEANTGKRIARWSRNPYDDGILFECNIYIENVGQPAAENICVSYDHKSQ